MNFNSVCGADHLISPDGFREAWGNIVAKSGSIVHIRVYPDDISISFTIKVSEAKPDGVALRNLDFLDNVEVVLIVFGVVRRGEVAACWLRSFPRSRTLTYD